MSGPGRGAGGAMPALAPEEGNRGLLAGIVLLHLVPLTLVLTGTRARDWLAFAVLYVFTLFGLGAGLHRYFAHRAFRTSRAFQFVLALAAGTFFGDAISFSGRHRLHHRYSDTEEDVHSPREGLWHCWIGHVLRPRYSEEEVLAVVPDLTRYPELRWLHRHWLVPGGAMGLAVYLVGGYSMFAAGFCLSCLVALHVTSAVNYFGHRGRRRRFATDDRSSNNALLGVLFLGEGWHNNHHRFPRAARAGLAWYEPDVLYCMLKALEGLGLIWQLREVPRGAGEDRRA